MFGGSHGFGTERRESMVVAELGHPKAEGPNRDDRDRFRKRKQRLSEDPSTFGRPRTGQPSTPGGHHALAQPDVVQVRCRRFVRGENRREVVADLPGQEISKQVVVEDR